MIKVIQKKALKLTGIRWTGFNLDEVRDFVGGDSELSCFTYSIGDWFIRGIHDEFYTMSDEMFQAHYEIIGEVPDVLYGERMAYIKAHTKDE